MNLWFLCTPVITKGRHRYHAVFNLWLCNLKKLVLASSLVSHFGLLIDCKLCWFIHCFACSSKKQNCNQKDKYCFWWGPSWMLVAMNEAHQKKNLESTGFPFCLLVPEDWKPLQNWVSSTIEDASIPQWSGMCCIRREGMASSAVTDMYFRISRIPKSAWTLWDHSLCF